MKPTIPKDTPAPEVKPIWRNPYPQGTPEAREESLRVVREAREWVLKRRNEGGDRG